MAILNYKFILKLQNDVDIFGMDRIGYGNIIKCNNVLLVIVL